jgi:aspartate/methionine/tyrosine aminotransferase
MTFARRTNWNLTTNAYTRALEEHRLSGGQMLDLTASNPTTIGLQYGEEAIRGALAQAQSLTYEPTAKGLLSAREAVAAYYAERGLGISPEDLILTTSTSEAYSFVFRLLCNPGDAVLVPTPSYPLFDFLADLQDVKLRPYELVYDHGWQMDFHSLRMVRSDAGSLRASETLESPSAKSWSSGASAPECKAVLVVHPNNPTGSFVKREEAAELAAFCTENHLAILADEVFLDYPLHGAVPLSFAAGAGTAHESVLTFTLSGLSKISGLPQMKVAWIAVGGPEGLKAEALRRLEIIADTYLSMNAPIQWAVPEMLAQRHRIQQQLMARIEKNLAELDRKLAAQTLCTRLAVEGGWYAVLRVPITGSDEELAIALLRQTGVLVQPGHFYDFTGDGRLVLSLITPSDIFTAGIERLLRYIAAR